MNDTEPSDATKQSAAIGPNVCVGGYTVLSSLGSGGQSEVFLAVHPTLHKTVVLKFCGPAGRMTDPTMLANEAKILADLHHSGIARIYDLREHAGRPFMVMDYIQGRTLEQFRQDQPPFARGAADVVAKVASAAGSAHRAGVLHLDIKPNNIIIDDRGEPWLIDFGIARVRNAWSGSGPPDGALFGTLQYMAPEQARGENATISSRTDVFSLGAVLYFLLTGRPPYSGTSFEELVTAARTATFDVRLLAACPRRLRAVCLKAMALTPTGRFANGDEFATALRATAKRGVTGRIVAMFALAVIATLAIWLVADRLAGGGKPAPVTPVVAAPDEVAGLKQDLAVLVRFGSGGWFTWDEEKSLGFVSRASYRTWLAEFGAKSKVAADIAVLQRSLDAAPAAINPRRPDEQWPTILALTPGDWATLKKIKRNLLEAAKANAVIDPAVNATSPFPD